jgi:energy-converting hydrogenase B subunit D
VTGLEQALTLAIAAAVVGLAAGALFARGLFHSVVLFIVFGLVMALAWVRLGAFDVALAEAAIGAGLVGALLIDAVRQIGEGDRAGGEE